MKPYLLSLMAGLLVGGIYSLLGVRSPAPPVIALVGLLGILVGEQAVPLIKSSWVRQERASAIRSSCDEHVSSRPPENDLAAGRDV